LIRCFRLKKENENYRQQLLLFNSKEKDQQIEFLRQTIRASEDALLKERNNLKKTKTKKDERYKSLLNQVGYFYLMIDEK
jgi:FtsZ-binding cell division protein ZapB